MSFLVHITDSQNPPKDAHVGVSSFARGLYFSLSLHLLLYFVYASRKNSYEYICEGSHEPWLLPDTTNIKISCAGPNILTM